MQRVRVDKVKMVCGLLRFLQFRILIEPSCECATLARIEHTSPVA